MPERSVSPDVFGIENEYSCMLILPGNIVHEIVGRCHSVDVGLGLYQEPSKKGSAFISQEELSSALETLGIYQTKSGMLSNGARLYIDPSGPEYATAETTTAEEAVIRNFDGDAIILAIFKYLHKKQIVEGYQFNRRTVDHNRSSRGVHLNTMTHLSKREPTEIVKHWIATLNVVKGAIFGAGGLLVDDNGETAYHHSPRLSITTELSAKYGNYRYRPLVRYPFKPEGHRLSRIETVTSDSLNFAWPLRASMVVTNALVGLIELGYGNKLPLLKDPVEAAHTVGRYGNEHCITVIGRRGEEVSVKPLDVMRDICGLVIDVDDKKGHLSKESRQVIPEVYEVSDRTAADMYAGANQVESVTRLITMERKMEKDGLKLNSERMCRFDYAWDWIGGGIAETLRKKGIGWQGFNHKPSTVTSNKKLALPPLDTRAHVRGEAIRKSKGKNKSDWSLIDFDDVTLDVHPLSTQRPKY